MPAAAIWLCQYAVYRLDSFEITVLAAHSCLHHWLIGVLPPSPPSALSLSRWHCSIGDCNWLDVVWMQICPLPHCDHPCVVSRSQFTKERESTRAFACSVHYTVLGLTYAKIKANFRTELPTNGKISEMKTNEYTLEYHHPTWNSWESIVSCISYGILNWPNARPDSGASQCQRMLMRCGVVASECWCDAMLVRSRHTYRCFVLSLHTLRMDRGGCLGRRKVLCRSVWMNKKAESFLECDSTGHLTMRMHGRWRKITSLEIKTFEWQKWANKHSAQQKKKKKRKKKLWHKW